jgi:hypothetical protein
MAVVSCVAGGMPRRLDHADDLESEEARDAAGIFERAG